MRVKIKAGYRIAIFFMEGCGIKIFRWERYLFILTDGMRRRAGCGMKNGKSHIVDVKDIYSDSGLS